ncbi:helix-turn-helix domain-containing protein [Brevibacillus centrosporus]|uniref:helix-turn-helix domain-containing protein n=1 Tax=Brevibacillus centrosporus TaxID=54910 RepID=UPI003B02A8DF
MPRQDANRIIPSDIGARLRKIRKERGITLQAVAEETGFSIGKLSNIERGQMPTIQDIETISSCINIKIEQLLLKQSNVEVIERIKADLTLVSIYLSLNLLSTSESLLSKIHNQVESLDLNELLPAVYFSWGEYYLRINDYLKASTYFKKVINSKTNHLEIHKYRLKSLNALSTLEYIEGDVYSALRYVESAERVFQSGDVLIEDQDKINTYFNCIVFNMHIDRLDHALKYCHAIEQFSEGKMYQLSQYIQGIIYYLKRKPAEAIRNITKSMNHFRNENDIENLILCLNALYVIYKSDPMQFQDLIFVIENHVLEELIKIELKKDEPEKVIIFFQLMISMSIRDMKIEFAERLLQHCDGLLISYDVPKLKFRNHHLWAQLYRSIKQLDKELTYLELALSTMEDDSSVEKAMVMAEYGFATNEQGPYRDAVEIFYKSVKAHYDLPHHTLIPAPRF